MQRPRPAFGFPFATIPAWPLMAVAVLLIPGPRPCPGQERAAAVGDAAEADDQDSGDGAIAFPSDRLRERQLDRAQRLLAEERWSDAATLLDEILAADKDFFFRADGEKNNWQSIKAETGRLVGGLPRAGRDAYELQFRARADRLLEQAVASDDAAGIVAVARRWFHTPAGARATLVAAIEALEANQPLAAAAWLDRLAGTEAAAAFEPTLSVMRAVAWLRAGDRAAAAAILERARGAGRGPARIGGRDVSLSFPQGGGLDWLVNIVGDPVRPRGGQSGDWLMHRGEPSRNGVVAGACPLLVPRYRVPLARHPEESRLLEARRRFQADQELGIMPVGVPLAVNGKILLHNTLGLLAVDFDTGKRVWLQAGGAAATPQTNAADVDAAGDAPDADGVFSSVFEDGTSGTLSSDGRLAFVVESPPESVTSHPARNFRAGLQAGAGFPGGWRGNTLSAYDVAGRGGLAWRLNGRQGNGGSPWFMGPPLPIGEQLLVLVEEKGEIRLDVLEAATGRVEWSQPLAEIDEDRAVENIDSHGRRLAGLSPALAEGIVICPTGAGAVVAVDLATRTLLWAHDYPQAPQGVVITLPNGIRVRRANGNMMVINGNVPLPGGRDPAAGRWLDATPLVAGGRVLLTPGESQELHCLDLRRGTPVWRQPRRDRLHVAGVVDERAIVVGRRGVEAIDLATGKAVWTRPLAADQGSPSGRGILTASRLLLPLDTPEVVEIDLADGRIAGRSPARGGAVPGNLVAYRGEVISQGVDSLDVFHQAAALESRIETALEKRPDDAWALAWSGQLALDRGDVRRGVELVRRAHELAPERVSPQFVGQALRFALVRNFPAASGMWREAATLAGSKPAAAGVLRTAVDGFLAAGDFGQAWEALEGLLAAEPAAAADAANAAHGPPIFDGTDPQLSTSPPRWLEGRFGDLLARAPADVRTAIDAVVAAEAGRLTAEPVAGGPDAAARLDRLRVFVQRFGRHPAAAAVRRRLVDAVSAAIENSTGDELRDLVVERDFALLGLARLGDPADRAHAAAALAALRPPLAAAGDAWPVGRVESRRGGVRPRNPGETGLDGRFARSRLARVPVLGAADSFFPGLDLAFDMHQQTGLIASDGFGRTIGEPIRLGARGENPRVVPVFQAGGVEEAAVLGRVAFLRTGGGVGAGVTLAAVELAAAPAGAEATERTPRRNRQLWLATHGGDPTQDSRTVGFAVHIGQQRVVRDGAVPLGLRASEPRGPDDAGRRGAVHGGRARCSGVPVLVDRSLKVHDPRSGAVVWERQRLPAGSELFGDEDHLCVCPADGRQAVVLSMVDGRRVRTLDLPRSEQRLLTCGRRIVAVQPATPDGGEAWARGVRIELLDPLDGTVRGLGEFPGESRAAPAGERHLGVVEPSGRFTLLDLDAGTTVFQVKLPDMPAGLAQLQVIPWADRLLVFVGRAETTKEQEALAKIGSFNALPGAPGGELTQPLTGSLWAVERTAGDMLWPVPVTVFRHGVQRHQAAELPILLFARAVQPQGDVDRPRLDVLLIDKRTGQAAFVDDRLGGRGPNRADGGMVGVGMHGDPATHTITLTQGRPDTADVVLEFTGGPAAPKPPFQAAVPAAAAEDSILDPSFWIRKIFKVP
jgi:outer membrane protein assembly factor BamB